MSKFDCRCGYTISNTTYPATHEGKLISEKQIDDSDALTAVRRAREVIECPQCWRLWIEKTDMGNADGYVCYIPDGEPLKLSEQQGGYRG